MPDTGESSQHEVAPYRREDRPPVCGRTVALMHSVDAESCAYNNGNPDAIRVRQAMNSACGVRGMCILAIDDVLKRRDDYAAAMLATSIPVGSRENNAVRP